MRFLRRGSGEKRCDAASALPLMPPMQARLYRYWLSLAGGREMPSRDDLNPVAMAWCIGNAALVEVDAAAQRFRYVTHGARLIELYGRDFRGRYVDEIYKAPIRFEAVRLYEEIAATRRPVFAKGDVVFGATRTGYTRLMLPLSATGAAVDHVLLAFYPDDPRITRPEHWQRDGHVFSEALAPLN